MTHTMKLQKTPFTAMLNGNKNIELRLNDEKRQQIQIGDKIIFCLIDSDEIQLSAVVSDLYYAETFEKLFTVISLRDCGYKSGTDISAAVKGMRKYYTEEQEKKYGVVGIKLTEMSWCTKWLKDEAEVLKLLPAEKHRRTYSFDYAVESRDFFTITSKNFIVKFTGGSIKFYDRQTETLLKLLKGFNYLYTGDIKPDETEVMALENDKHFFIFSLKDFSLIKRITLPKKYNSIDVCGEYSDNGKLLYIPSYCWTGNTYDWKICIYETENYSLIGMESVSKDEIFTRWHWQ